MATVKITDLQQLTSLNSNTSNTVLVGVDLRTSTTSKISATTLAEGLYRHNTLNVGNNTILFPNTIGQFAGTSNNYVQVNLQNINNDFGTADYIVTANTGSDAALYIDLGFSNKNFNNVYSYNGLGSSLYPLDGYLYVQGNTAGNPGGNLVIGTASRNREIRFIAGGVNTENVLVRINSSGLQLRNNANLSFTDGTTQTTAAASNAYTIAAYTQANTVTTNLVTANNFLQANDTLTLTAAANYTDAANTKLKAYSDGRFLANTTGTFAGNLTVTGNTIIRTSATIYNPTMPGNNQYLIITGTSTGALSTPSNPGYTIHTAVDTGNRIVAESYGVGSSIYAGFIGRRGRGTAATPSAVQNNDIILRIGGNGYGATKFSQFSDARIEYVATETHTDTSKGTQIQFWTTESGSNTATQIGTMNGNTVTFTGVVNPQKGFKYTPNNITTIATAYTLDFQRDSMIRMSVNDNMTVTLQNYQPGKIVEVWITNSAAQNKTITHGCLSNNSTKQSATFTIASNACAYLKYFSIGSDLSNTFVSVTSQ